MTHSDHACDHHHDDDATIKTDFLQVTATANNREEAETLIKLLTEKKLVACAQVQGPSSVEIHDSDAGWRCRFKTSHQLYSKIESELALFFDGKTYSVKALPIVKGSSHFLNWLKRELEGT